MLLSSAPEWRFLTQTPIEPEDAAAIRSSLQFGNAPLMLLPIRRYDDGVPGEDFVSLPGGGLHLASESDVPTTDWRLHLLEPAGDALAAGARSMRSTVLGLVGAILVFTGLLLYRRHLALARAEEHLRGPRRT